MNFARSVDTAKGKATLNPPKVDYFDGLAEEWDVQNRHDPQKLEQIMGLLELRGGQTVLDVGTGTGVLIPYLLESVGSSGFVTAVDYSAKMIEVARLKCPRDKFPNLRFEVKDINDHPVHGQYDAIVCYSCFPHFEDQQATISHLAAGLAAHGKLMIAHSESREAINMLHRESSENLHHDYLPAMSEISQMLQAAGLEVTKKMDTSSLFLIIAEKPSPPVPG